MQEQAALLARSGRQQNILRNEQAGQGSRAGKPKSVFQIKSEAQLKPKSALNLKAG